MPQELRSFAEWSVLASRWPTLLPSHPATRYLPHRNWCTEVCFETLPDYYNTCFVTPSVVPLVVSATDTCEQVGPCPWLYCNLLRWPRVLSWLCSVSYPLVSSVRSGKGDLVHDSRRLCRTHSYGYERRAVVRAEILDMRTCTVLSSTVNSRTHVHIWCWYIVWGGQMWLNLLPQHHA